MRKQGKRKAAVAEPAKPAKRPARPASTRGAQGRPPEPAAPTGPLVIIGGHEDKSGKRVILREVARLAAGAPIAVATLASQVPGELWEDYEPVFRDLGASPFHLELERRDEAYERATIERIEAAGGVFFTGGDQIRLTSKLGGTTLHEAIRALRRRGGVVAGTSAGASVMSATMIVAGPGDASPKIGDALRMAPGLGFLQEVVIDQHFAQRGRIGRLAGTVAQNPAMLGVGIDENTAIVIEGERCFRVVGAGAVYVLDGRGLSHSNLCSGCDDQPMSLFDLRLHVLASGDEFDLIGRRPRPSPAPDE